MTETERGTGVAAVLTVGRQHAADRLLASQKLQAGSPYLGDNEPPTPAQVSAVLHALADHTLLEHLLVVAPDVGADRAHLGDMWATTSGLGRCLQGMGDWIAWDAPTTEPR